MTRHGFWRRRFAGPETAGQRAFDAGAGVVLPVVWVLFDPIVFRGVGPGPLLGEHRLFAYAAIGLGVSALAVSLLAGPRLPAWLAALFAGVLAAGAAFALAIGVVLLPLSLIGLLLLVGALGFSPFLTAFALARRAWRALERARACLAPPVTFGLVLVGATFAPGGPWAVHQEVARRAAASVQAIMAGDSDASGRAVAWLRRFNALVETDAIVWAYERETDPARRARLADAYRAVTDGDIEERLAILLD